MSNDQSGQIYSRSLNLDLSMGHAQRRINGSCPSREGNEKAWRESETS